MAVSEFNGKGAIRSDFAVEAISLCIVLNAILDWWLDSSRPENSRREPDAAVLAACQEHTIKAGNRGLGYRLAPPTNMIKGQRYPSLVRLHGAGEVVLALLSCSQGE